METRFRFANPRSVYALFRKARLARVFLFICALAFFAACPAGGKKAVLVLDRFCPLSRESEKNIRSYVSEAESLSGAKISVLKTMDDNSFADLSALLEAEKPDYVFIGAFSAMRLEPLTDKHPDTLFCVLDAPENPIPGLDQLVRVYFDRAPVMAELGSKIKAFMEKGQASSKPVVFMEQAVARLWNEEPLCAGLDVQRLELRDDDKAETIRAQLDLILAAKPSLCLIAAGSRSAFILDLVTQKGYSAPVILDDAGSFSAGNGIAVLAFFTRSYGHALGMTLKNKPRKGEIVRVPVEIRYNER